MSATDHAPHQLTRIALATYPRTAQILLPVIGLAGLAVAFAGQWTGMVFLAAGVVILLAFVAVSWLAHRHRKVQSTIWHAAAALSDHDAAPCFGTDEDGVILYRNPAATQRFPSHETHLTNAVIDLFASPHAVFQRMRAKADEVGAATEEIAATKGALRISAHRIDQVGYIWRIYDGIPLPEAAGAAKVALPMMRVSKANTILDMNRSTYKYRRPLPSNIC